MNYFLYAILSSILGFISALIFGIIFFLFFKKSIIHGPNSKDIITKVYYDSDNDKYYKFKPIICVKPLF